MLECPFCATIVTTEAAPGLHYQHPHHPTCPLTNYSFTMEQWSMRPGGGTRFDPNRSYVPYLLALLPMERRLDPAVRRIASSCGLGDA